MDKYVYDENNGLWYELHGDYYLPCLTLSEEETQPIGIWGRRHLRYLKEHRKAVYVGLCASGKLNSYLADIDRQAKEQLEILIEQMKCSEGITEQLKAKNGMDWVRKMNNIRHRAEEIVRSEIIYA